MVMVADWPAWRVPADGATFRLPSRVDGSLIDQETGPPCAVIVIWVPPSVLSRTDVGATVSVPGRGGGGGGDDVLGAGVVGAGVVGAGDVG